MGGWKSIDLNISAVALARLAELSFSVICLNPDPALHQVDGLHAGTYQLPRMNTELSNGAVGGSEDFGVAQIELRDMDIRHGLLTPAAC